MTTKKQANKDIAEVVKYFYETYKKTVPDATHYKQGHALLGKIMSPSDDDIRVYTLEQVKQTIDFLYESNIAISSLAILSWPDILRAVSDNDTQAQKIIINAMLQRQAKAGLVGYKTLNADPPRGW